MYRWGDKLIPSLTNFWWAEFRVSWCLKINQAMSWPVVISFELLMGYLIRSSIWIYLLLVAFKEPQKARFSSLSLCAVSCSGFQSIWIYHFCQKLLASLVCRSFHRVWLWWCFFFRFCSRLYLKSLGFGDSCWLLRDYSLSVKEVRMTILG